MSYLHITTNVSITAPIDSWISVTNEMPPLDPLRESIRELYNNTLNSIAHERMVKRNHAERNYTWDYQVPVTIDNLSQEQADKIRQAWDLSRTVTYRMGRGEGQ